MSTKNTLVYLSLFLLIGGFVVPLPSPAKALATTGVISKGERMEAKSPDLTKIIQRGDTMIADRLKSLQKLLERINGDTKLSTTDKTNLINDVTGTIDALNTLKLKIDADTDATIAKADVKSIVTSFHIYVLYEPKIRLLIVINNLQTASTTIQTLVAKVQTLVTDLKNQGKDVTSAQSALTDISNQLSTIDALLATNKTLIGNVNFQTTDPQSVFTQVRKDLATVRADFAKIRADFATIRGSLKLAINVKAGTSSSSAK